MQRLAPARSLCSLVLLAHVLGVCTSCSDQGEGPPGPEACFVTRGFELGRMVDGKKPWVFDIAGRGVRAVEIRLEVVAGGEVTQQWSRVYRLRRERFAGELTIVDRYDKESGNLDVWVWVSTQTLDDEAHALTVQGQAVRSHRGEVAEFAWGRRAFFFARALLPAGSPPRPIDCPGSVEAIRELSASQRITFIVGTLEWK